MAEKKAKRATTQGLIEAYIHTGGRIGAMIEVNCETDFVARTDEFKELAHNLVMQVAALSPQFIAKEEVSEGADIEPQASCLLLQPYIKDPGKTVQDVIVETNEETGVVTNVQLSTKDTKIYKSLSLKIAKTKNNYRLARSKRDKVITRSIWYHKLQMKDIWLRKFMMKLKLYLKETEKTPGGALFGGFKGNR